MNEPTAREMAEEIVKEAGWSPDDTFGTVLVDMLEPRLEEDSWDSATEDMRSYFSREVVEALEAAAWTLYVRQCGRCGEAFLPENDEDGLCELCHQEDEYAV